MKKHNKQTKSLLAFVLALLMVISACPMASFVGSVFAADAPEPPVVRKGDPVATGDYWDFYEDGEIWFTAEAIEDIDVIMEVNDTDTPWMDTNNREDISGQIITIVIMDSVKTIKANAFKGLKPTAVYIPASVTTISEKLFAGSQITDVYYGGKQAECTLSWPAGVVVHYEHAHTGNILKHAIPATCTTKGYEGDKYCSLCGYPYAKGGETDKANHEWSKIYAYTEEPTCSKKGYQAKFCVNCGTFDYSTRISVPATGEHDWIVKREDKFDSCDKHVYQDNHIVMHCKDCSAVSTDEQFQELTYKFNKKVGDQTVVVDSKKSVFSELTDTEKAAVINKKVVEYNLKLLEMTTVNAADDSTKTDPKALHHYIYDTVDPKCTEPGRTDVSCEWCTDYHDGYDIPATGHSNVALGEVRRYSIPATCTENGERRSICTVCGAVLSSEIIPNRHTVGYRSGTWVTEKEPNCAEKGYQWLKCNYCDNYIDYGPGEEFDDNGVEKTGHVQKDLDATPNIHHASRWFKTLEATCTEKGEEIKICTVEGCPYYSNTDLGKKVCKISNRDALDELIAVTREGNANNFKYEGTLLAEDSDKQVYDVANEVNMAILAAYREAGFPDKLTDTTALKDALTTIFTTAVDYHGSYVTDKKGNEVFKFDKDTYACSTEEPNESRFVFSEIVEGAVDILVDGDSVINTTDDVVKALEDAWTALGDDTVRAAVEQYPEQVAKITDKSLAKHELAALGHDFERCDYYFFINNEFIPAFSETADGETTETWYRIKYYDKNGDPVKGEALTGTPIAGKNINCVKGGGNMISQCRREECGALDEPILVKKGPHSLLTKHVARTCETEGYDETYCTLCDYKETVETDPPLTHNFTETTIKPSTCSKTGIKVKICSYCGEVNKATYQTLALLPHTDSPVKIAATCTESGKEGKVCSVCGRFDGKIIPELGHDYKEEVFAPTCTEVGYTAATCTRCGDAKAPEKFVPVAGHQFGGKAISIAATCLTGSYTYEECKVCGEKKIYNQRDNALGHQLETVPALAPTCTSDGRTEKIYCTRPGCEYVEKQSQTLPALGHRWKNVDAVAATCTEDGHNAYVVCEREGCGAYQDGHEKVVEPKTGHNWVEVQGYEPTCYIEGMTEGRHCTKCNAWDPAQEPIEKLPHEFGEWEVVDEATAFRAGTKEHRCIHCGESETMTYKLTFWQSVLWVITHIIFFPIALFAKAARG